MSPIQQMLLGVGAVATKTYVDDVFSTFLYTGTNATLALNNGIDLATEGGMVISKSRSNSNDWNCWDTERGVRKFIKWNSDSAEQTSNSGSGLTGFNSNGFTLGTNYNTENWDGGSGTAYTYTSNSFRKAPGFFDVVTWTGNGTAGRTIAHNLGCVPGLILIKTTSSSNDWIVYHRAVGPTKRLILNSNTDAATNSSYFNDTAPTSSVFSLGDSGEVNVGGGNPDTYVAYLFAGGESTAATARSVGFDGSDDYIRTPDHSDLDLDTNQFTIEMWVKSSTDPSSGNMNLVGQWGGNDRGYAVRYSLADQSFNGWGFQYCTNEQGSDVNTINGSTGIDDGQWHHLAVVRESSTIKLYTDGNLSSSTSISGSLHITNSDRDFYVGSDDSDNRYTGNVSNVRVVVGTALYTSAFKPPTEPLTNVTNTKLLCCNNSSVTGSTVSPGTIYSGGGPTASTDSPFDDPAGFVFGKSGSESVIKCGSYVGNGNADGPEINLGWEPQWVMLKNADESQHWQMYDSMRGIATDGDDEFLLPNLNIAANSSSDRVDLTSTGFKLKINDTGINGTDDQIIYIALRRSDGYVGKPPELGTDVFAMDTSSASSVIPTFDSTFPVDFGLKRKTASTDHWLAGYRLLGQKSLSPDRNNSETDSGASLCWDSNLGFGKTFGTLNQGWMWKRHAGFDVVTYKGNGVAGRYITHTGLGKTPEMIWLKSRSAGQDWFVYHKGLNNGSNPGEYELHLNNANAEDRASNFYDTDPTATTFRVDSGLPTNYNGHDYIAMLFASVDGISKVGSYTGTATTQTITTGFQPRMLFLKNITDDGYYWQMVDTTRGWTSSSNKRIYFNDTRAQDDNYVIGEPLSTGFTITGTNTGWNKNNSKYIYYAHA